MTGLTTLSLCVFRSTALIIERVAMNHTSDLIWASANGDTEYQTRNPVAHRESKHRGRRRRCETVLAGTALRDCSTNIAVVQGVQQIVLNS